jgi:hypothetical protein
LRQQLVLLILFVGVLGLLGLLNAASYVQQEQTADSEADPNRSSYNAGSTGTNAYYSLLSESGHRVTRWQEPATSLNALRGRPSVLVLIGPPKEGLGPDEVEALLRWVANGGRLVIIDREPRSELVTTTANWSLTFQPPSFGRIHAVDPADPRQMTDDVSAVRPAQPSIFTQGVNAVQPSIFSADIRFERFSDGSGPPPAAATSGPPPASIVESPSQIAPTTHLIGKGQNLLVDAPFGSGRIVILADPFIVSNTGIAMADNAQLAVNLVAVNDGLVAFDEYHHGYGASKNRFLEFFAGTPVIAIFLQLSVILAAVFYSKSRRFARPLPEPEPNRLSKLEYVSAMAELQQRTRAYDLAIENTYSDFRRRVARVVGLEPISTSHVDLAAAIAERTEMNAREVADTLFQCEEIIRGEPTNKSAVVSLIAQLRSIETLLGIARSRTTSR